MNEYRHLIEYEHILNTHDEKTQELIQLLDFFEENGDHFKALMSYYTSEQRDQDLEKDRQGLIPERLHRGVLSEDAIYTLYADYREQALRMLEIGTTFFK
mgnify:CR=1 FL=1